MHSVCFELSISEINIRLHAHVYPHYVLKILDAD